jgi:NADPH-dependent FMN reductase
VVDLAGHPQVDQWTPHRAPTEVPYDQSAGGLLRRELVVHLDQPSAVQHTDPLGAVRHEFAEIPIGELPMYSPDYDSDFPAAARALKSTIAAVDAVLFVTPEYNRSIPGALKNAIDWGLSTSWRELVRRHPGGGHRCLRRPDRHGDGPAKPVSRSNTTFLWAARDSNPEPTD